MVFSVKVLLCQNIEFGNNESALSCVTSWVMHWGKKDFMVIWIFYYAHVKFIPWIVIGCIELQPILFLSASWMLAGTAELVSIVIIIVVYDAH